MKYRLALTIPHKNSSQSVDNFWSPKSVIYSPDAFTKVQSTTINKIKKEINK